MPVRVCVAIREASNALAAEAAARAMEWADLVEIRADYIPDLDLQRLFHKKRGPVLFTIRSSGEGGEFAGTERSRLETIVEAARQGADYVDVEFSAFWQTVLERVPKERVVLSYHNFEETPEDLESLLDSMAGTGAGIIKIATRARSLADNRKIALLLARGASRNIRLCALAMGREGIPSRVLGPLWGSWMTFASMPGSPGTADGQISADELIRRYRIREIGPSTRLYGVLGKPLGHTLSPRLHNAAFAARNMDATYLPLEGAGLDDFLEFHSRFPVSGLSVTIPYKEEACAFVGSMAVEANETGAVNTLVVRETGWHGENTDVDGFLRPLHRRLHIGRTRAVVLGAGGAARAVIFALRSQGASTCVVARSLQKAQLLAEKFQSEYVGWDQLGQLRWDLLVNTTPVGMYPEINQTPVPAEWLTGKWVYDLVYNPRQTRLLKEAAKQGCGTIPGSEMFLGQALKQQQLWCGTPPPDGAMEEALEEALPVHAGTQQRKESLINDLR